MVNIIWVMMIVIGLIYGAFSGSMDKISKVIFTSAEEGVTICFGLISVLVFWLGMMKIAEKSGLLNSFTSLFKPIMKRLFPEVPSDHPAMGYILSNTVANILGLGNAATPMGIKAMEQLKKLNHDKLEASRSMITLLALNTSSLTLIPTTVIAIRMKYHSSAPTEIVGTTISATACSTIAAIIIDRIFYYRRKRKGGGTP